jgi:hypothetical protein
MIRVYCWSDVLGIKHKTLMMTIYSYWTLISASHRKDFFTLLTGSIDPFPNDVLLMTVKFKELFCGLFRRLSIVMNVLASEISPQFRL